MEAVDFDNGIDSGIMEIRVERGSVTRTISLGSTAGARPRSFSGLFRKPGDILVSWRIMKESKQC